MKITKSQLRETIRKMVLEQINNQQLSPAAQKALELSRQAKQNKDAQVKRAAAKASMKGISVEGIEPDAIDEQSAWRMNSSEFEDLKRTKFRVNFGDGHVSNVFPTKKEAEYELTFIDEPNAFIQYKDLNTGEWFHVRHLKEQHRFEGDKRQSDEMMGSYLDTSELQQYEDDLNDDHDDFISDEEPFDWEDDGDWESSHEPYVMPPDVGDRLAQAEWDEDEAAYERDFGTPGSFDWALDRDGIV